MVNRDLVVYILYGILLTGFVLFWPTTKKMICEPEYKTGTELLNYEELY
jgi:hypothetical protein